MREYWEIVPFERSIQKVKYTKKVPSSDYLPVGAFPIVSQEEGLISGYWNNDADVFHHYKPVVIFGDHTRIIKYVDFDFVLGADGVKILLPIDGLSAKFLSYYLRWYKVPSLGYSRHFKLLKEVSVPVPPLQEQEKIVSELDCLSGIIEKKKQQLKELDNLAQSIFYDMFGDPTINEKGWEQLPFEQSIQKVKYTRKLQTKDFLKEGLYPIISQEEGYISGYWNDVEDVFHIPAPVVIFGDHTRVLKYVDFDFVLGADGVRVLLPIKSILPRFLFSYLKASKIPSLGYSRHYKLLKEMMVSVPPFDLQIHFTEKIEAIEKQKELIKKSIQETETLFNSRMDFWFNN